jgi:hypothetical protein
LPRHAVKRRLATTIMIKNRIVTFPELLCFQQDLTSEQNQKSLTGSKFGYDQLLL